MTVRLLAFTDRGYALAQTLAAALDGQAARCGAPQGLAEWTAAAWKESQALVFVGAAGIAVRATYATRPLTLLWWWWTRRAASQYPSSAAI